MPIQGLYDVGSVETDGLIIGNFPVPDTKTVTIKKGAAAQELKRGAVLSLNGDGTYSLLESGGDANVILCDDTSVGTTADVVALAYSAGRFNEDKLSVADGYTLSAADKEALRKVEIIVAKTMKIFA